MSDKLPELVADSGLGAIAKFRQALAACRTSAKEIEMTKRKLALALLLITLTLAGFPLYAQQAQPAPQPPKNSNDPIERIKDEGLNRSQVMQTLSYLTDVIGPRLTASPNLKRANEW